MPNAWSAVSGSTAKERGGVGTHTAGIATKLTNSPRNSRASLARKSCRMTERSSAFPDRLALGRHGESLLDEAESGVLA